MENYSFQRVITTTPEGKVFLYIDKATNSKVTITKIDISNYSDVEKEAVLEEERCLATLEHPNILQRRQPFVIDDVLHVVADYADGGTLEDRLIKADGNLLDEDLVLTWFVQICLALKYTHDRNFLHRDIQPKNVLFLRNGIVKLSGFNNSYVLKNTANFSNTAKFSPNFLSPEVCQGKEYTKKSDIWELGCLFFEMLAQHKPFEAKSFPALVSKIIKGQMSSISYIYSTNVRNLSRMLLHRHPSKRPSINQILSSEFILQRLMLVLNSPVSAARTLRQTMSPENFQRNPKSPKPMPKSPKDAQTKPKKSKLEQEKAKDRKNRFKKLDINTSAAAQSQNRRPHKGSPLQKASDLDFDMDELGKTVRLDQIAPSGPGDDLREKVRQKREEAREEVFRKQHPEFFAEDGEEAPPKQDLDVSALIHISDSSDDEDAEDTFAELAAIAKRIFDHPPGEEVEEGPPPGSARTGLWEAGVGEIALPDVTDASSLNYRIESLRSYLEGQLGLEKLRAAYDILTDVGEESSQEEVEKRLRAVLTTPEEFNFFPLIQHLRVCEESVS